MSGQRWDLSTDFKRKSFDAHVHHMLLAGKKPVVRFLGGQDNPKTPSQIKYAHSLCQALADHSGVSLEEAKKDVKVAFGVVVVSTSCVDGSRTARLKSFADYTNSEMIGFITALECHLVENQIPFTPAAL